MGLFKATNQYLDKLDKREELSELQDRLDNMAYEMDTTVKELYDHGLIEQDEYYQYMGRMMEYED